MTNPIYISRNDDSFDYFICNLPENDNEKLVAIENGIVSREALKNIDGIEHVFLDKCKKIEEFGVENCKDLRNVIWQVKSSTKEKCIKTGEKSDRIKGLEICNIEDLEIQRAAFKNCSKLQTVIFPIVSGNLVIEKEAFAGCTELRTLVFPKENVTPKSVFIDEEAFLGCSNLTFICNSESVMARFARAHDFKIVTL